MESETNVTTDNSTGAIPLNAGKTFTQEDVDRLISERLDRQKKASDAQRAKEREDIETAKLAAQQQYKELAEKHEARVKELEPVVGKAERYEAIIKARLENERKSLPKPIQGLLDKMDAADQLEWIETHKAEVMKPAAPNINDGNKGSAAAQGRANTQDIVDRKRKSGLYS